MYIGNFIVVDQVTQYDDDLNAFGHRYGEPPNPNSMFDNDTDFYGTPKCAFDKVLKRNANALTRRSEHWSLATDPPKTSNI